MFNSKLPEETNSLMITLCAKLDYFNNSLESINKRLNDLENCIQRLEYSVDENIRREISNMRTTHEQVQERYMKSLESKLVNFDDENARLKRDKEAEHRRLSDYFYLNPHRTSI